jgi:HNH endonuclease
MYEKLLNQFYEERIVTYRGEKYLVRDNGVICRLSRSGKRKRPLDNKWTFGNPCKFSGYMTISSERVHRIVATSFHGEQPSEQHIVDHIDTNRKNNRPNNLRWVTRLDNVLENPITRRKIEIAYGSIEEFLNNPKEPRFGNIPQNYEWMRAVSEEEAKACRERFNKWAASNKEPSGVQPGEWVFSTKKNHVVIIDKLVQESLTPIAIQKNWRTPCEFPLCPEKLAERPLNDYLSKLKEGETFSRNKFGQSTILEAQISEDEFFISVITESNSVKPVAVAKVSIKNGKFCHESYGSFFSIEGATKQHYKNMGLTCDDIGDCIDNYC